MIKLPKNAYTLSEFILLLVLGIIFAGVLVSVYVRRVATRQARQAETLMRAARYEQEDLCFAGRKYEVYANHLKAFSQGNQTKGSLLYDLGSGKGISVRSKFYGFTLQMPSYADGRICCDNCQKLNRYYSSCALLLRRPDFVQGEPECFAYSDSKKQADAPVVDQEQPTQSFVEKEPAMQEEVHNEPSASVQPSQPPLILPVVIQMGPSESSSVQPVASPVSEGEEKFQSMDAEIKAVPSEKPFIAPGQDPVQLSSGAVPEISAQLCEAPAEKGSFYTVPCSTYQADTQGAVLFAWNSQTCRYEAEQNCLIPAVWKAKTAVTREEKGVYPSDINKLCPQLLAELGCSPEAGRGKECFEVGESCYTHCEITQQNPTSDSDILVLYNVSLSLRSLQCSPSKKVTVEIS